MDAPRMIGGDEFLSYAETAGRYGVSRRALQDAVATGRVATARPGRKKLLRLRDVEAWLEGMVTTITVPSRRGRPRKVGSHG